MKIPVRYLRAQQGDYEWLIRKVEALIVEDKLTSAIGVVDMLIKEEILE